MSVVVRKVIVGPVRTNCYIAYRKESKEAVVIDPGEEIYEIDKIFNEYGVTPIAILLTHGHFDHVGAVMELKKRYGIKAYLYQDEQEVLATDMNLGKMFGCNVSAQADEFLSDSQKILLAGMEFTVIHTPGHTKGSCCYYLSKEKILFAGDTLFYHSHGRTDFPSGSQSAIIHSIKEKLMKLDDDVIVYTGHDMQTDIGSERPFYDFD